MRRGFVGISGGFTARNTHNLSYPDLIFFAVIVYAEALDE